MRKAIKPIAIASLLLSSPLPIGATLGRNALAAPAPAKKDPAKQEWRGQVPAGAEAASIWTDLANELAERKFAFGAIAAAERMTLYFNDVATKEAAYRAVVRSIRNGYPFLVHDLFRESDLQPAQQDSFYDAYFTYKGLIEERSGVTKWSQAFFKRVNPDKVPEHIFYDGIKAYKKKEFTKAIDLFTKLLDSDAESMTRSFKIRVARTIARIHFEAEQYEKSFEIYDTFLLKLNPMFPADWLEAAWNLFYLNRYPQALSYLYNLEAPSSDSAFLLEKYILRGLIYKQLCADAALESLNAQFMRVFGNVLNGIKTGQPLTKYPSLKKIKIPGDSEFQRVRATYAGLRAEWERLGELKNPDLARQLYTTELQQLNKTEKFLEINQLSNVAEQLVLTSESLSFLKYEMQRAKVDPDKVFADDKTVKPEPLRETETSTNATITIGWPQNGDYWRPERLTYSALIQDRCKR